MLLDPVQVLSLVAAAQHSDKDDLGCCYLPVPCALLYPVGNYPVGEGPSRVIWLKRDVDLNEALFGALVQRIFREDVPKFAAAVLQTAVRWEYREATFSLPVTLESDVPAEAIGAEPLETEPGETLQTHRPAEPNPTRNVPHPGPIPQTPKLKAPHTPQLFTGTYRGSSGSLPVNDLEATQIEDLKENQYAWHCQVCLTEKTPGELAPDGSYVELAENRRLIMEAEHADQKHAGGARNAGNLILLCHFHHHQLGKVGHEGNE